MRQLTILWTGAVMAILSACGPSDSGTLGPAPTGAPPTVAPPTAVTPGPQMTGTITVQTWFTRADKIVPTRRTRPKTTETSHLTLTELVAGPTPVEIAAGVGNAIRGDTTFEIKGISAGVATVSFPSAFYAGGKEIARLRQAQVVYSLTQFPTVTRVGFQSGGEPVGWPLGRADYLDLLPRIIATDPGIGETISSPVTVTGTANVREATVNLRILNAQGKEIATKFTTATCGGGCRGDYSVTVSYACGSAQSATIEVYEVSGEDGSRVATFAIPVLLAACRP